ncbi:protein of unknown function [[Clostridium] aminophilum]|uniref:DUF4422 domain-containing protein n=2 Tax=[Clostridium] aminophilum TaxID=1526 RepID=A0A1I0C9M1_9FIRM|nr:protein of unknown function [[Clostridium] aminophilum]
MQRRKIAEKKMRVVTYISTYGAKCLHKGKGICLEAGAKGRDFFRYPLHDDTGDNISKDNAYYGDLTVLYWIWKNGEKGKGTCISFRHYNKYLMIREKKVLGYLNENPDGWIVARKVSNPPHNFPEEWRSFRKIINEKYPLYFDALRRLYRDDGSGSQCNATNMFITSSGQMHEYCCVLFKICRDLREEVGNTDHKRSDQRYCAFMAERFLSVYLETHHLPRLEVDVCRSSLALYWLRKIAKSAGFSMAWKPVKEAEQLLFRYSRHSSYDDGE